MINVWSSLSGAQLMCHTWNIHIPPDLVVNLSHIDISVIILQKVMWSRIGCARKNKDQATPDRRGSSVYH